ncbi:hypothetical protein F4821DRAFT_190797 [Hypoxylon rubiginosum]|uniref:Uncharacterized protein n=1 Tax=Hypoxylon rubiginosum TaxID=110542 RepID=A0ACC0CST7_9PEZI|nr:hypothetical protein F4821DRAFT_190797 [Hypoxylon rubiginosum]
MPPKAAPVKRQASTTGQRKPGFYPKRAKVDAKGSAGTEKPPPRAPVRVDSDEESPNEKEGPAGGPRKALLLALEAKYPEDMILELRASQPAPKGKSSSSSTSSGKKGGVGAVYTVTHTINGTYSGHEFRMVGTYDSTRAANERVMSVFRKEYGDYLPDTRTKSSSTSRAAETAISRRRGTPGLDECRWWVDGQGLLSLAGGAENSTFKVRATVQEVRTDGLEGESLLKGSSGVGYPDSDSDGSAYDSEDSMS